MPNDPVIRHIRTPRTARYCTLGGDGDVRSVWYVLHGYRQLADRFSTRFAGIATPNRMIVAPEALNRFYLDDKGLERHGPGSAVGATWMTRHDRESEIADYVGYLDRLDRAIRPGRRVHRIVLGFSQGSATAARWVLLGRGRASRLVLWAGVLPHDLDVGRHARQLRSLEPVYVGGERDDAMPLDQMEAERARLESLGVDATIVRHSGGHSIDATTVARLAALIDGD